MRQLRIFYVFFLMSPPPPTSTLFPYTTLFRSDRPGRRHRRAVHGGEDVPAHCRRADGWGPARVDRRCRGAVGDAARSENCRRDRKSTRLNSSHVRISYAVFCLKKKITKSQIDS